MNFTPGITPLERLGAVLTPSCAACADLRSQGLHEPCRECDVSFDLREYLNTGAYASGEQDLKTYPRLRNAFKKLESGDGSHEAVHEVLSHMLSKAQFAVRTTANLVAKERDDGVRDALTSLQSRLEEAVQRENAFAIWLQRRNMAGARYELDALRQTLHSVVHLDEAYKDAWRARYQCRRDVAS